MQCSMRILGLLPCCWVIACGAGAETDVQQDDVGAASALTSRCPSGEPALALCVSFDQLLPGGSTGDADVGGYTLKLEQATLVPGRVGQAIHFGQSGRAVIEGFQLQGQQLTVEAWVRAEGAQQKWASVVDYWANDKGFWLGGSEGSGGWEAWSGLTRVPHPTGLTPGQWQHLAAVYSTDGQQSSVALFINGVEVARKTNNDLLERPPLPHLYVGSRGDRSDYFKGTVDQLMVWSEPRTAAQICADAEGSWKDGSCSFTAPVGAAPGPCQGVSCSGHGTCHVVDGWPSCSCEAGYLQSSDWADCVAEADPCDGAQATAATWLTWLRGQLPAGAEAQAQQAVSQHQPGNSAWAPQAEAWTTVGLTGTLSNSLELACLGYLEALSADPKNPVALTNAATCLLLQGYSDDAEDLLACSLKIQPQNASARAAQAYIEYAFNGDLQAALKRYEQAAALDPKDTEWPYQALQVALELGDPLAVARNLAAMPASSTISPGGYRGVRPADGQSGGGYCCPCGQPATYNTVLDCTNNCSASLSCFTNICQYTGKCQAAGLPFSLGLKLCYPPSGLQVCFSVDTDGNLSVQLGASVFMGLLGVSAGLQYNVINGSIHIVGEAGTNKLPINVGSSVTFNPSSGKVQGAVGLSGKSGTYSGQVTVLSY